MGHEALAWNMTLALPTPTLDDTASDWARLERGMRPYASEQPVEPTLDALRDLGSALRRGVWQARISNGMFRFGGFRVRGLWAGMGHGGAAGRHRARVG